MKYTVEAINGKEVTVVFENGQRAKPVIAPDLTPEEIDIEVGRFDSTYRQVGVPTKAVQIGEIRTTIDPKSTVPSNHSEPAASRQHRSRRNATLDGWIRSASG